MRDERGKKLVKRELISQIFSYTHTPKLRIYKYTIVLKPLFSNFVSLPLPPALPEFNHKFIIKTTLIALKVKSNQRVGPAKH